jgi:hypothetical protein
MKQLEEFEMRGADRESPLDGGDANSTDGAAAQTAVKAISATVAVAGSREHREARATAASPSA